MKKVKVSINSDSDKIRMHAVTSKQLNNKKLNPNLVRKRKKGT